MMYVLCDMMETLWLNNKDGNIKKKTKNLNKVAILIANSDKEKMS